MPYLKLKTNVPVTEQQSAPLLNRLSKVMAQGTSKPERYVLIELQDNNAMLFAGSNAPLAYLECKSIGLSTSQAKTLSAAITQVLTETLAIKSDRIYIEFSDCPAEFWGWNGGTFG